MFQLNNPDLIFKKIPWMVKYKSLLLFFIKVLFVYLAFLLLKLVHRTIIDPDAGSALSTYLRNLNIYALAADTIIYPSKWLLNMIGYDTIISERTISIPGSRGIIIHAPCLGFNVFSIFIALIIAYPVKAKIREKALFILSGIILIHLLNILRISALLVLNKYSIPIMYHHEIFNLIIYGFVFMAFYRWIHYDSKKEPADPVSSSLGDDNKTKPSIID
jgi:exosortase/archaeosortase family protein